MLYACATRRRRGVNFTPNQPTKKYDDAPASGCGKVIAERKYNKLFSNSGVKSG
jgi:hypothetical protein